MSGVSFPIPPEQHADALAAIQAEREALRATTLAAIRGLGEATTREIAAALDVTDGVGVNRLRSRLVGYERQAYVRHGFSERRRVVVWRVVEGVS